MSKRKCNDTKIDKKTKKRKIPMVVINTIPFEYSNGDDLIKIIYSNIDEMVNRFNDKFMIRIWGEFELSKYVNYKVSMSSDEYINKYEKIIKKMHVDQMNILLCDIDDDFINLKKSLYLRNEKIRYELHRLQYAIIRINEILFQNHNGTGSIKIRII
tara:strand:+ start:273 stop:743 length:471 start_codon:yes stop_codon:yes gene_type:complete